MSQWVGIDGFGNKSLLQAGVQETCTSATATPTYQLSWEDLPHFVLPKAFVNAGDPIEARVRYHG